MQARIVLDRKTILRMEKIAKEYSVSVLLTFSDSHEYHDGLSPDYDTDELENIRKMTAYADVEDHGDYHDATIGLISESNQFFFNVLSFDADPTIYLNNVVKNSRKVSTMFAAELKET